MGRRSGEVAMLLGVMLLFVLVGAFVVWGILTAASNVTIAATGLTLAASNAVLQTTIMVLTCTLVALLPLVLWGAFKVGQVIGEHKRAELAARVAPMREGMPVTPSVPMLPASSVPQLPEPQTRPIVLRARRSRRTQHAHAIAQRWFR